MNVKGLRVFALIIEHGTLARASEIMNLSPPATSRLLRLLEEDLGYPLFDRRKKRLVPLPAVERLYPEALRILASLNELPKLMREIEAGHQLPLKIVCNPRFVSGLAVPALHALLTQHPEARVSMDVRLRRDFGRNLAMGQFHLGIGSVPEQAFDVTPEPLAEAPLGALLPTSSPLAQREILSLSELANEPNFIAPPREALVRQLIDNEAIRFNVSLQLRHELSSSAASHQMVKAGRGFTITERFSTNDNWPSDTRFIPISPPINLRIGLFRSPIADHPLLEPFIEHLRAITQDMPPEQNGTLPES